MSKAKQKSRFWDERYHIEEYVYGKEPNTYFSEQVKKIDPGLMLLPGEGEGRNAVYAALNGWTVDAFDQSNVGQNKAQAFAREQGVKISYKVKPLEDFHFIPNHYDAIGLLFFHTDPESRIYLHQKVCESLKPGGSLILEGFHKEQLNRNTGGPKAPDLLFEIASLSSDFSVLETILLEKQEVELNEGPFHQGMATVVRYLGIKPNYNQ